MERKRGIIDERRIPVIGEMKFLLIMGVVLIHSFSIADYPHPSNLAGFEIVRFISDYLSSGCVPCFFILSGYLFFNRINVFSRKIYFRKLRNRVVSLLIPYILWNLFCLFLLYIKHSWFNMSGLEIFLDDGSVNVPNLIKGFWSISQAEGRPYAFAFWFIRNLIVFVILSPLVWIIIKNRWLFLLLFLYVIFSDFYLYGFFWFIAGAFLAHEKWNIFIWSSSLKTFFATVLLILFAYTYENISIFSGISFLLVCIFTFILALDLGKKMKLLENKYQIIKLPVKATFIIYGTHQCYCSKMRQFWSLVLGTETSFEIINAFLLSFLSMVILGIIVYIMLRNYAPKLLSIITGGRIISAN